MDYKEDYYLANGQDSDRPALWMYERLWKRFFRKGPALEFGCGQGYFARRLAKYVKVYGLESNPFAVQHLQENLKEVEVLVTTSSLTANSISSITALHVFEHISDEDLEEIGKEFARILEPGGRILAVTPNLTGRAHNLKGATWSAFTDSTHINLKRADEWSVIFESQWGLRKIACFADGYYDFPYGSSRLVSLPGDAMRAIRTLVQFLVARPILKQADGENIVFILEKSR